MLTVFLSVVLVTSGFGLTRTSPVDCDLHNHKNGFIDIKYHFTGYDNDTKLAPPTRNQDVASDDINKEIKAMLNLLDPSHTDFPKADHHHYHKHEGPNSARQPYFQYTTLTKSITVSRMMINNPMDAEADRATDINLNGTVNINQTKTMIDNLQTATDKKGDKTTDFMPDPSANTEEAISAVDLDTESTSALALDYDTSTNSISDLNTEVSPQKPLREEEEDQKSVSMIDCSSESGYSYFPNTGSCYKPYKEHLTWSEARLKCMSEGADLLVINNEFEDKVIKNIINNYLLPQHKDFHWFWVGITSDDNDVYRSVYGDNMNEIYNVWKFKQNRKCGAVYTNGQLEDAPCNHSYGFICEKPFGIVIKIHDFQ